MDVIIQWVSQIIIFLLLAAIIDLLIPATTMKKYIKLVVGLILILIFLKPVFQIFNMNIENALETSFSRVYNEQESNESMENLIKMQKSEIQASQDAYILEQMANQLKEIAKIPLHEEYQMEIAYMEFTFSTDDYSYDGLEEIIVYVKESANQEGVVSDIEEVEIDTQTPIVEEELNDEGIANLLQQIWELEDKTLIINWEGGTS